MPPAAAGRARTGRRRRAAAARLCPIELRIFSMLKCPTSMAARAPPRGRIGYFIRPAAKAYRRHPMPCGYVPPPGYDFAAGQTRGAFAFAGLCGCPCAARRARWRFRDHRHRNQPSPFSRVAGASRFVSQSTAHAHSSTVRTGVSGMLCGARPPGGRTKGPAAGGPTRAWAWFLRPWLARRSMECRRWRTR